jgi:hypothetical protein
LRVWRLYLRSARNIFETEFVSIYQTLAKPATGKTPSRPIRGWP